MRIVANPPQDEPLSVLQQNDEESFSRIYRELWPSLYNTAYKRLKDKEQSRDIVQNVFIDLWHRRKKVSIINLSAYLHTAVKFQVYKQSISSRSNSEFLHILEEQLESTFKADEKILSGELSRLVELWIDALPLKRRKIFLMHYYKELSTQEIAKLLNISQKTVQNQLNTAAVYIRRRFSHFLLLATMFVFSLKQILMFLHKI